MARQLRASAGGVCYHAINRGNGRAKVFRKDEDYRAFLRVVEDVCVKLPMRILAYVIMPNHFHLVLWPHHDGDLSRWMQWLLTAHVRRYHKHSGSRGHGWQGRFKAFPVEADGHLLTVLRYVERNPLRANMVARAEDWPWSSLGCWSAPEKSAYLHAGPVRRLKSWMEYVNQPMTDAEVERLRECMERGRPYGGGEWASRTAARLGLESSLRPLGRPRKIKDE